jgi:uridine monophosphate synthetase
MTKDIRETGIEILKGCIEHGDFVLRSGKKSKYYVDLRPLISSPDAMNCLASLIWIKLPDDGTSICGLPYAGIPHACFISSLFDIPMVMLRAEQKYHGTKKMIEGRYEKGDHLILIDDVLTTGSSVMDALPFLKEFKIDKVVIILDREEGGREKLEEMGIKVESIFKISELTDIPNEERVEKAT